MCSNGNDESVFKRKKEFIDVYDKIDNKMNSICEVLDIIVKINCKLKKNNSYINSMFIKSLLGEPQLKYKINVKIYDTLYFVWYEIYRNVEKLE